MKGVAGEASRLLIPLFSFTTTDATPGSFILSSKTIMERLEQDLRFFRQELENEHDPFRRNLLLSQIRDVEQEIVNLLRQQRAQVERENRNLREALEDAMKKKKK
jgi:hypothetical protein